MDAIKKSNMLYLDYLEEVKKCILIDEKIKKLVDSIKCERKSPIKSTYFLVSFD